MTRIQQLLESDLLLTESGLCLSTANFLYYFTANFLLDGRKYEFTRSLNFPNIFSGEPQTSQNYDTTQSASTRVQNAF